MTRGSRADLRRFLRKPNSLKNVTDAMNFSSKFLEDQDSKPYFARKMCVAQLNNSVETGREKLSLKQFKTFKNKSTQTNYRDSETQTDHLSSSSMSNYCSLPPAFSATNKGIVRQFNTRIHGRRRKKIQFRDDKSYNY